MFTEEIFEKMRALNEEVFSADKDGIEDLAEFEKNDEKNTEVEIIDTEAETEEDIKDSYIGSVILDCCVCHSKLFRDRHKIKLNDEMTLADVGEECPYCYATDGYKIVGVVADFDPKSEETKEQEEKRKDDELKESLEEKKRALKESSDRVLNAVAEYFKYRDDELIRLVARELDGVDFSNEDDVDNAIDDMMMYDGDIVTIMLHYTHPELDDETAMEFSEDVREIARRLAESEEDDDALDESWEQKTFKTSEEREKWKDSNKDKYQIDDIFVNNGYGVEYRPLKKIKVEKCEDKKTINEANLTSAQRHNRALNRVFSAKERQDKKFAKFLKDNGYTDEQIDELRKDNKLSDEIVDKFVKEGEKPSDILGSILGENLGDDITKYQRWVDYDMKRYGRISDKTEDEIKKAGLSVVKDQYGEYEVIAHAPIEENLEKVEVETEDAKIEVKQEGEKVVVEAEKKEEETVKPMEDEEKAEIALTSAEDSDEDFVDIDVAEFDEETFDKLGESYLKRVYNNIDSYKTTSASSKGSTITLEGVIKFKSGNEKKTGFIFEARDIDRKGKLNFIGENCQITPKRKAFAMRGTLDENKKFIAESLNYNYCVRAKNGSQRMYGTVRNGK